MAPPSHTRYPWLLCQSTTKPWLWCTQSRSWHPHGTPVTPWARADLLGDHSIGIFWLSRKTVSYHSPSAPFNTQRLLRFFSTGSSASARRADQPKACLGKGFSGDLSRNHSFMTLDEASPSLCLRFSYLQSGDCP